MEKKVYESYAFTENESKKFKINYEMINLIRRIQISDLMFNQHRKETYYTVVALILLEFVSLIVTLLLQNIQISIYNTFMNIAICIIVCFHTSHNSKVWREYSKEYKKLEDILEKKGRYKNE